MRARLVTGRNPVGAYRTAMAVFRAALVKPFGKGVMLHSHQRQLSGKTGLCVLFLLVGLPIHLCTPVRIDRIWPGLSTIISGKNELVKDFI
jgi:hypothetical protein